MGGRAAIVEDRPQAVSEGANRSGGNASSGGSGTRMDVRREPTRELILEATYRALVTIGYERITTRRIAEEAGVNIATLHYYFGTKEGLLSETVRFALERNLTYLRGMVAAASSAPDALARVFQGVWDIVRQRRGVLRYDLVVRGLRDAEARAEAERIYATYRAIVEEICARHARDGGTLRGDLTAPQLAYLLVASVDGIVLQHAVSGDDDATVNSLTAVLRYALAQIGADSAGSVEIRK